MLPEVRPRGIGEILDTAVAIYRARFRSLMAVTLAVVIPVQVLATLVLLSAEEDEYQVGLTGTTGYGDNGATELAAAVVVIILGALATAFVTAAATRIVADAYVDAAETPGLAVRTAARRLPALVGLTILSTLGIIAGLAACVIPGLWLQAAWSVAVPALILEGVGVIAALGRSFRLTKTKIWHAFGVYWVAQLLTSVLALGLGALLDLLVAGTDSTGTEIVVQSVANTVASIVTTPFVAAALVALYFDLRIRNEGFDVQMMLVRLDSRRPGAVDAR